MLRDIALGIRTMRRLGEKSWTEMYSGMMTVETDGWVIARRWITAIAATAQTVVRSPLTHRSNLVLTQSSS